MSSSRTLLRKLRTSFTCIKPRFDPSIILLYIAASVEQYCDITQVNALPENEGILEAIGASRILKRIAFNANIPVSSCVVVSVCDHGDAGIPSRATVIVIW